MFVEIILSLKNCRQLTRHGLCLRNEITVDMVKKLNWKFDFRFKMLFTVSFRFMFRNAVSLEGCDKKEKAKLYFSSNQVSDYFHFICLFRYLKTEIINRNRDSGDWHLQIQQLVRAIPWRQSKGSKESHLEINRVVWSVIKKKGSRNNYQYYLILFTGFKRETTQDSD